MHRGNAAVMHEQLRVALEIANRAAQLADLADKANLPALAYLLVCAGLHARRVLEGATDDDSAADDDSF
jgi:hypothetical protein